jgi:DNA-directed RNA polymerase specialized sigma24 family protein
MRVHTNRALVSDVDEALVKRARAGSSNAFDQLVRRHQAALRGFLRRIVSEPSLADDLAQETFLRLGRNYRVGVEPTKPLAVFAVGSFPSP